MKRRSLMVGSLGLMAATLAFAQPYPNKPIKLQVPFAPGGTTDIVARVIADPLGKALGQSVVVENRAGGGGIVGAAETARSAPDGYNLGMATVSTTAANPAINPKTPYNPLTDFTPIINIAATPNIFAVHPSFPARDYKGFVAELKKNPGKYSYASSGTGGIGHLQTELYKSLSGTFITHIPYRGTGPALTDVLAGRIELFSAGTPALLPHIKSGALRCIAVGTRQRIPVLPDVPTMAESGYPNFETVQWYGIHARAGTPQEIVTRLQQECAKAMLSAEVKSKYEAESAIAGGGPSSEYAAFVSAEQARWKEVVIKAQIKPA